MVMAIIPIIILLIFSHSISSQSKIDFHFTSSSLRPASFVQLYYPLEEYEAL